MNNSIDTLYDNAFGNLSFISTLYLSNNNISIISNGAFSTVRDLSQLYLDGNRIKVFPYVPINNLTRLEVVNLSRNEIQGDSFNTEDDLSHLTELDLSSNALTEISPNAFSSFPNLRALNLAGNSIYNISNEAFNEALHTLDLDGNSLTESTDFGFLLNLRSLTSLRLSNNNLTMVPKMLGNLTQLQYLDLSDAHLVSFTEKDCQSLVALKTLDLSRNGINVIDENTFGTQGNLEHLHLQNNNIRTFKEDAFHGLRDSLISLDISYNQLQLLEYEVFASLQNLQQFNFHGNSLICDCQLLWLRELNTTSVQDPFCAKPAEYLNHTVLQFPSSNCSVTFSNTTISSNLTTGNFSDLSTVSSNLTTKDIGDDVTTEFSSATSYTSTEPAESTTTSTTTTATSASTLTTTNLSTTINLPSSTTLRTTEWSAAPSVLGLSSTVVIAVISLLAFFELFILLFILCKRIRHGAHVGTGDDTPRPTSRQSLVKATPMTDNPPTSRKKLVYNNESFEYDRSERLARTRKKFRESIN
ncbi:leucine-rich repeat-containing G-protein coupled receptor 4 [Lingula anatina]|uniref:Leucine-rich repeat-containing G-protein coupled receptor 4 n=1 Tax=Lingula anatina TaxID=7574 RepID=A0A1S3JZU2_LINAN|nr:leucine-rich repeat-containing G-protein coupled receptor 4 [Lingula anatina]|eukprot:XP_013415551.1 leucine-rich repeat-containing G-protein coupled receptor 4 [Lingula anatina]